MATKAATRADIFAWVGKDRKGKVLKGELSATNIGQVRANLRGQGIQPISVKKKKIKKGGTITPKDIAIFSRQLATMMSSGVPLVQSFEIIGRGHENPAMQDLILRVKANVEAGSTLGEALGKHPLQFDALYVNLVTAGEHAGILEDMLHKIAIYQEKMESLKSKVRKALIYPTAILIVALIVSMILLLFVVPQFEELFSNFGADLPALTKMVINLSVWVQENWFLLLVILVGIPVAFIQAKKRSRKFGEMLDRYSLRLPIIGQILEKSAIARFARTLSTMFAAGTPLVEAMVSVAGATGNIVFYNATLKMKDEVATGTQLQVAMRNSELFPNMVVQMVAIGEEAGSLDQMLGKVADFYEEEVDNLVEGLSALIEPIIIAFLGIVVGGLVIAMYLPIFKMGQVI